MNAKPEPAVQRIALRITEAADTIGISRTAIYNLLSAGALPSVKVGGSRVVLVEDLNAFLARNRREAA